MNLRGITQLAYLGTKVGVDLGDYKADDGSSIISVFEFSKPYANGEKKWEHQQISSLSKVLKE